MKFLGGCLAICHLPFPREKRCQDGEKRDHSGLGAWYGASLKMVRLRSISKYGLGGRSRHGTSTFATAVGPTKVLANEIISYQI